MPSVSKQQLSSKQDFINPFYFDRQVSEQSFDMMSLIQKYDLLRRKREALIKLMKRNYSLTRLRSEMDEYFVEEDPLLILIGKVEARYERTGCSEVTEKSICTTHHKSFRLNLSDHKLRAASVN